MSNPFVVVAAVCVVIFATLWLGAFAIVALSVFLPDDLNDHKDN